MERRYWVGLGAVLFLVIGVGGVFITGFGVDGHGSASDLDVSRVNSDTPANQTIAFSTLTSDQQQVFELALADEDGVVKIPTNVDEQVWIENEYVTYQNQTYHVAVAVSS
ncbi:hypothetical protein [Halobacterium wangiae]|uniref:hypothetical protein n=1 Tax=Halobacterium wangiae TaxID=2902623 RepID=UPI001E4E6011|nr:hypothetical protein [Halobacterium wangiae]